MQTDAALVSLEREFAERMGIQVGDTVDFLVGAQPLQAQVANLRELDWQTMQPNFFLVFPPRLLADYPATFMTSFYLAPGDKTFLNRFIRAFPTVTVIDHYLDQPGYMPLVSERGSRYLYYIVEEVEKRGMPMEVALIPLVESTMDRSTRCAPTTSTSTRRCPAGAWWTWAAAGAYWPRPWPSAGPPSPA